MVHTGVQVLEGALKEEKARKRRRKTAVVGDMKPLEDSLPTLELLLKTHTKSQTMYVFVITKPFIMYIGGQRECGVESG